LARIVFRFASREQIRLVKMGFKLSINRSSSVGKATMMMKFLARTAKHVCTSGVHAPFVKLLLSNAFCQTPFVKRLLSNAFFREEKLSIKTYTTIQAAA
jgi:hypothetical protein